MVKGLTIFNKLKNMKEKNCFIPTKQNFLQSVFVFSAEKVAMVKILILVVVLKEDEKIWLKLESNQSVKELA